MRIFMNWMCGTLALIGFLCSSVSAQSVPYFQTHATMKKIGSNNEAHHVIDMIPDGSSGASHFLWSGASVSFQRMVVIDGIPILSAYCQTAGANNSIKRVSYFFTPKDKSVQEKQELKLIVNNKLPLSSWPIFGSTEATSDSEIPVEKRIITTWPDFGIETNKLRTIDLNIDLQKAELFIKFKENSIDMSGLLYCQVEDVNGYKLTSNLLKIIDIKNEAILLNPVQNVPYGFFSKTGYCSFQSVPQGYMSAIQKFAKNTPLIFRWDFFTDVNNQLESNTQLFPSMRLMPPEMLGHYVIDEYGTLYLNMWSQYAKKLKDKLMGEGGERLEDGKRLVLVMFEATKKIGYKYYTKENMKIDLPGQETPARILPKENEQIINTYVGNTGHAMRCGFLVNGTNLQIIWKFRNEVVSSNTLSTRFGIGWTGSGTMLDLSRVKVVAGGPWSCHLLQNDVELLKGSYNLRVVQYPTFGEFVGFSSHQGFDGNPPRALFVMDRSDLNLTCRVRSMDANQQVGKPNVLIDGIIFEQLCSPSTPSNQALCTMKSTASVTHRVSGSNRAINERTVVYSVKNLQFQEQGTSRSMSHLVTCSVNGKYDEIDEELEGRTFTAVNVIPRPKIVDFNKLPSNCSTSDKGCPAKVDHQFHCVLKDSRKWQSFGIVIKKYWLLGSLTQALVNTLPSDALAKNYTHFSEDGNTLTIKRVTNSTHRKILNTLGPVKCVVELFYPSYIQNSDLMNAEIIGDGVENPIHYSAQNLANEKNLYGPMIYSTAKDSSAQHMIAHFELIGEPEPVVSQAGTNLFIPIGIASFLVLLILFLVVFIVVRTSKNKGASYHMGQKELDQGLDPILELKEQQTFKEYQRREEAPIRGSRWSMASSVVVKSQSGSVYLDEEYGDFHRPGDQPRFVGDRTGYADF